MMATNRVIRKVNSSFEIWWACPVNARKNTLRKSFTSEHGQIRRLPTTPYHITPHDVIPYHTIPYLQYHTDRTVSPYHTVPYHTSPYHSVPYHNLPYHITPCRTIPYHPAHHTTPCRTEPYYTLPYRTRGGHELALRRSAGLLLTQQPSSTPPLGPREKQFLQASSRMTHDSSLAAASREPPRCVNTAQLHGSFSYCCAIIPCYDNTASQPDDTRFNPMAGSATVQYKNTDMPWMLAGSDGRRAREGSPERLLPRPCGHAQHHRPQERLHLLTTPNNTKQHRTTPNRKKNDQQTTSNNDIQQRPTNRYHTVARWVVGAVLHANMPNVNVSRKHEGNAKLAGTQETRVSKYSTQTQEKCQLRSQTWEPCQSRDA